MSSFLNENNTFGVNSSFNSDDIASACQLLGLSGPLEALLKGLRSESLEQISRPNRTDRGELFNQIKQLFLNCRNVLSFILGQKSGQESWGKDSGARDLSPESHKLHENCGNDSQITESEFPSSSMMSLARKVTIITKLVYIHYIKYPFLY